jgi:hypothetical protein
MGEAKRRQQQQMRMYEVTFLDAEREPQEAPNPDYPEGIDLDATEGATVQSCKVPLPYPAPRCGAMVVQCNRCGFRAAATVAGRPDDPRSVRIPCKTIGSTGRYPEGISRRPGDEGELAVAVSAPDTDGNMYIDFGKEVAWLSLPRERVIDLARQLATQAGASKVVIE